MSPLDEHDNTWGASDYADTKLATLRTSAERVSPALGQFWVRTRFVPAVYAVGPANTRGGGDRGRRGVVSVRLQSTAS